MQIADALGEETSLAVSFPKGQLNIVYRPMTYTVAELEQLQRSDKDPVQIVNSMLDLLVSWDLTDGDGAPVPIDYESLRQKVPTAIFLRILRAVNEDQGPGESSGSSVGG
jgi:hypothetical protein